MDPDEREGLLKSILKDYDLLNNGGYHWHATVTAKEIEENLQKKFGRDVGRVTGLHIESRGASGRATRLWITGSGGSISIGKELMIRRLLAPTHLYSSWIDIKPSSEHPDRFRISGRGWGHGVGLCQIGAARMATEGHDFRSILSFYYPGSRIARGIRQD